MHVPKTTTMQLAAAREKEEAGQWSEAATLYQKIVDTDPANELAVKRLLIIYRKQKDFKKELAAINQVLKTYELQNKTLQESWLRAHPRAAKASRSILQQLGGAGVSSFGVNPVVAALLKRKETLSFKLSGKKKPTQKSKQNSPSREPVLVPVKQLPKPIKKKTNPPSKKVSIHPLAEATPHPSMFIINLTYLVAIDKIDSVMPQHHAFLDKYYTKRQFLVSGRKIPRTGGIILARAKDRKQLEQILKQDPFIRKKLASADIIEFSTSQADKAIVHWFAAPGW